MDVKRVILCLLLLPLSGCSVPWSRAAPDPFACSGNLVAQTVTQAKGGQPVPERVVAAIFARLDGQPRVEVRETRCEAGLTELRYIKPRRMQYLNWLNRDWGYANARPIPLRNPTETQVGDRLGYAGHLFQTEWAGIGVNAHRLLLPDAWGRLTSAVEMSPTFYGIGPPDIPVRDLHIDRHMAGGQWVIVERWRAPRPPCIGVAQGCPGSSSDPALFPRYTAVLHVDRATGLPISMTEIMEGRGTDRHGRWIWTRPVPLEQVEFQYGGNYTIRFVKG